MRWPRRPKLRTNVQDAALGSQEHQVLLGLHGELVGDDDQEVLLGGPAGPLDDFLIQGAAFAGPGGAEVEL